MPDQPNYQKIIEEIRDEIQPLIGKGAVANYIPALACVNPSKFGIAVQTIDGRTFETGDTREPFSIQSISKVFTLTMAFRAIEDRIWERVGKEPSGNPFNSLIQLENEDGIPRNPFINAGAIVVTDIVISHYPDPLQQILDFIRNLTGDTKAYSTQFPDIPHSVNYDYEVARSEKEHGERNAALAHFMKSFGNIRNDVHTVLDTYFHQCSISMTCADLAKSFLFLANHGVVPHSGERLLTRSHAKRISSIMLTSGLYNESGDFAFKVGMPGKSGVGGGIVAIIPRLLSVAVWSPELDKCGNSLAGIEALELFTTKTGISIF